LVLTTPIGLNYKSLFVKQSFDRGLEFFEF
jgi:hypothetical protein